MVIWTLILFNLFAAVDPPNYNFSLDELKALEPGSLWSEAKLIEKYKTEVKVYKKKGDMAVYRIEVKQLRYKFPVFVHVHKENKILGFYAPLPSFFLHDVFHQSLINRYGKQDKYYKVEESSVYLWQKKPIQRLYSGTCTITCFPLYYSAYLKNPEGVAGYKPIHKSF